MRRGRREEEGDREEEEEGKAAPVAGLE